MLGLGDIIISQGIEYPVVGIIFRKRDNSVFGYICEVDIEWGMSWLTLSDFVNGPRWQDDSVYLANLTNDFLKEVKLGYFTIEHLETNTATIRIESVFSNVLLKIKEEINNARN